MATHPALRRCTPEPWPYYKVSCPVCARNVTSRGVSYLCNRCSGWVHSKCSGLQNAAEYRRIKDWVCSSCNSPPTLPKLQPPPIPTQAVDENSFTIMQFNANGIGNKLTELGEFLKRHNVKVVVIQESKLSSNSKTPNIQNFTTVRKDRRQGQGGGLLILIHKSINFSRKPELSETLVEPHLEELTITAMLGDTELIITDVYTPPASSCTGGYLPSLDHLIMTTDTLILGAPNDTAYKRWSCHSGFKLLCKLCRTSPPPAMGAQFTVFWGMPAMRTRWMAGAAAHKSG